MVRYITVPVEQNLTVDNINDNEIPSYISFRQALLSLAQVIGPLIMSSVFAYNMHYPFIIAGILFLVAAVLMFAYIKIRKSK